MNQTDERQINSSSPSETEKLAANLGNQLIGGEVIELVGDLGSGKTTFVQGLARGMGSNDLVASPTFTLSRVYKAGRLTLNHFDFYRLGEAGIMSRELSEIINDRKSVTVIEWGEIASTVLPNKRIVVSLIPTGESSRKITIRYPLKFNKIIGRLK